MATFSSTEIENARRLIEGIMSENGGMTVEDWTLATEPCRKAILTLRRKLGAATQTLATNLYSHETRFVLELIQNAEDAFAREESSPSGQSPFITFNVSKDKIVVECNESGFIQDDVEAICSIGESSKRTVGGYIGEKGIGFKSVFKIASRVHIQSGPFSFSFCNAPDDGGLGMVTPIPEPYEELPQRPLTRMTLSLKNNQQDIESLVKQFEDLPDTLLIFLKRLKKLTYVFHEEGGTRTIAYEYRYDSQMNRVAELTKTTTSREGTSKEVKFYWIINRTVDGLPGDDARQTNSSEIVLAFPLNAASAPHLEPQYVYSFLPIRRVGFDFLIQADFITQASRQDIFESARNKAILQGAANAFRDAVLEFCEHPVLQYGWMRYLPDDNKVSETFWKQLLPEIQNLLRYRCIIRTRSEISLEAPQNVRILADASSDEHGEPLFADGYPERYISRKYGNQDCEILKSLGLTYGYYITETVHLALLDLQSANSRFKSPSTSDNWHTRVAKSLETWLSEGWPGTKEQIRSLPVIPLHDGSWTSIVGGPVYYREDEDDEAIIPSDLGLRLFSAKNISNTARLSFYSLLGIEHIEPINVINLIRRRYMTASTAVSLQCSVEHVAYFFWKCSNGQYPWPEGLTLYNREGISRSYTSTDFYFPSTSSFGIEELTKATGNTSSSGEQDLGFSVNIINPAYLDAVTDSAMSHRISWSSFLHSGLRILRAPRLLLSCQQAIFSPLFNHIQERHPEKIIGVLKKHWSTYEILMTPDAISLFKDVVVGQSTGRKFTLSEAVVPFPNLMAICKDMNTASGFPFLVIPPELSQEPLDQFNFLSIFGVELDDGLKFYLCVSSFILWTEDQQETVVGQNESYRNRTLQQRLEKMAQLYRAIHDRCTPILREYVRNDLIGYDSIYVPRKNSSLGDWMYPSECVLDSPSDFGTKFPLGTVEEYGKDTEIMDFFRHTLQVPVLDWKIMLEELTCMSESNCTSHEKARDIYHRLSREALTVGDWTSLRNTFDTKNLIYVQSCGTWHKAKDCLWKTTSPIPGKVTLIADYADLKKFFVHNLRVKIPTLRIVVSELESLLSRNHTVVEITSLIWAINAMKPKFPDLDSLNILKIFPVKGPHGQTRLESKSADFAIVDRVKLEEAFEGKISILDFNVNEVKQLDSFLAAMGVEGKLMSLNVREESSAQGGISDQSLCEKFHDNAYALVRCAAHYNSPRVVASHEPVFELLRHAEVFRTSGITKKLVIHQDGRDVISEVTTGSMHISEDGGKLQIFVPEGERDRELCYVQHFPQKLTELFDIPIQAREIIVKVLQSSWAIHPMLLEEAGIVDIPGFRQPERRSLAEEPAHPRHPSPSIVEPDIFQDRLALSVLDRGTETPRHRSPSSSSSSENSTSASQQRNDDASSSSSASDLLSSFGALSISTGPQGFDGRSRTAETPSTPRYTFTPTSIISIQSIAYRELLDRVIKLAQCAATVSFPYKNNTQIRRLGNLVPEYCTDLDTAVGNQRENRSEYCVRVGAAGELYAFEFLSALLYSDTYPFGQEHWRSTIRHLVTTHEKYQTMISWTGAETSDIVYEDLNFILTHQLIARDYLPQHWASVAPKYFLEVKTTKSNCDTPFYISRSQYERMARSKINLMASTPPQNPEIYVIIRVFNLGRNDMDMRIYLDPKSLEEEGKLLFSADVYTVIPAR